MSEENKTIPAVWVAVLVLALVAIAAFLFMVESWRGFGLICIMIVSIVGAAFVAIER